MTTEKHNQHYIPKFYLRNFSFQMNGKQIGIFNTNTKLFKKDAKLKTQACKPFYYGKDGKIEDELSHIESEIAPLFSSMISIQKLTFSIVMNISDLFIL